MDMRNPVAQDILRRLAEQSDVLIHNFRPGIMARMGLAPEPLRDLNPGLIYCSLSGYGQTGPKINLEAEVQQLKRQRAEQQNRTPKPLDGVRVLDLSRFSPQPRYHQIN